VGDKEAARLMIAARAYMRIKKPSEALGLFRDVERLVRPETDVAFQAAYYRLLCFFQIEGRHVPDQVDAFLQLYRKSRPNDPRIHTALMMKAETLYSNKQIAEAAQVYNEIDAFAVSEKNRPGLLYQRGWCLAEAGDHQGAVRSLTDFIKKYPDDPRVPSALAKRAKAYSNRPSRRRPSRISTASPPSASPRTSSPSPGSNPPACAAAKATDPGHDQPLSRAPQERQEPQRQPPGRGQLLDRLGTRENQCRQGCRPLSRKGARSPARRLPQTRRHSALARVFRLAGRRKTRGGNRLRHRRQIRQRHPGPGAPVVRHAILQLRRLRPGRTVPRSRRHPGRTAGHSQGSLALSRQGPPRNRRPRRRAHRRNNVLAVEDNPGWKADGLLDRGRALLALNRPTEARKAADEALALHPQGRTSGGLRILIGDLEMEAGDPKKASAQYLIVVGFLDDKTLKPLALSKLVKALEAQGDTAEAEKYRRQLESEFPDWKTQ
jgi:tetratricopeptide (TPR) repeat protein